MAISHLEDERRRIAAEFADVIAAIRIHGDDLLRIPNVIAVSPGYRFRDGRITDNPAVIVKVAGKRDIAEVPASEVIPRRLGRVLVDVILADPLSQIRVDEDAAVAGPVD